MNKSKKSIKAPQKAKTVKKAIDSKIWISISIVLAVLLFGAVLFDQLYKATIITIDEDKYSMDDLSYYFYNVETRYDYYNQMFGGTYWDMSYDEASGTTMRDIAKQEAVETALYNEIMYREAVAAGYALTSEETEIIANDVESMRNGLLTDRQIRENGFTKDYLTEVIGKATLANRYRTDIIETLEVDDEAIKAGISPEDYRQYDIEYLFISTQTTDEQGNTVDLSEDEKTAAYEKIKIISAKANETQDWSSLIPEGEEEIIHRKDYFLESDTKFSEDFEAVMMAMENNTVSDIYEEENGYYVVRMINNNSTESYDREVETAITNAENEAFETHYKENIQNKYNFKINDNALKSIHMGSVTL
ncbi:hypothetical protein I5677_12455 [Mobilitalea sibirica]|uniref:Uncharacterized protein n=1 Tax=Mobilitalea sibirica TaxID=1462919 RepID=A0A8J7HB55_9FIRM|nr:hypothetical protein [Mobilitalea sibirica]MBH1941705.1 hypothetical protein [Mobilitalea sibirica]